MNPIHVIEGHINLLLKKGNLLPEDIKQLGDLRMRLCQGCHLRPRNEGTTETGPGLMNGKYCDKSRGGCGCDMEAKTLVLSSVCPIGRW